mmetsp:Transcript_1816/g.1913  ORF Transcript_1816/g.1913 Transcript_1816/m.1913 type:complete len:86 (-) Transcript_1816:159-416(-)
MQLFAKTLVGQTITIDVECDTTILEVKILTARRTHGKVVPNIVIFAGLILEEDKILADYNIQMESTVYILTNTERLATGQSIYGK